MLNFGGVLGLLVLIVAAGMVLGDSSSENEGLPPLYQARWILVAQKKRSSNGEPREEFIHEPIILRVENLSVEQIDHSTQIYFAGEIKGFETEMERDEISSSDLEGLVIRLLDDSWEVLGAE